MAHDSHHQETDTKAAFTGLIVGAIVLFVIVYGIVHLTNQHYAGEKSHAAASK